MNKVIVIVGPTASGKTSASIKVAKSMAGEVISADSRQIYRGLDIGSGKVTLEETNGVPHHLIDVADPGAYFSVEDFRNLGNVALEKIINRNNTPIICGGTGFYIDTLAYNKIYPAIDFEIKQSLNNLEIEPLQKIAEQELPTSILNSLDLNNTVRLRNRIGLWRTYGSIPAVKSLPRKPLSEFIWLGIEPPKEILAKNITIRTKQRIDDGLVQEVEQLINQDVSSEWLKSLGMEYRLTTEYIESASEDIDELKQQIILADLKYAKRQMTWFRRNKNIEWFGSSTELIDYVLTCNS